MRASDFAEKTCGAPEGSFWNLWSNGQVARWLRFEKAGEYEVEVEAYGQPARDLWPRMRVCLDMERGETFEVKGREPKTYRTRVRIEAGTHRLAVFFLNDYHSPDRGEDRNLYVGRVRVTPRGKGDPDPRPSPAPDWRREAGERIERIRKGDLLLKFVDGEGRPVSGLAVRIDMVRHAFPFGCAVSSGFVAGRWSAEDRNTYAERFAELFNHAVHENALKWGGVNRDGPKADFSRADRILAWCSSEKIPMRGHCILWANERRVPVWARKLPAEGLRKTVLDRIEEVLVRYRGKIAEHDLNNEMVHLDYFARRLGEGFRVEMFRKAHEVDPAVKMYVNDYNILSGGDVERYVDHIQGFLDAGAPVGGIGCQGHFGRKPPDPVLVKMVLDRLARFGLPIKITEFDLDTPDEGRQAIGLHDFYTVCFSHPAVKGILMWGFWAGAHWRPKGALFDRDWRVKPAARAYRKLVIEKWRTRASTTSDANGMVDVRAFYGHYSVYERRSEHHVEFGESNSGKPIVIEVEE